MKIAKRAPHNCNTEDILQMRTGRNYEYGAINAGRLGPRQGTEIYLLVGDNEGSIEGILGISKRCLKSLNDTKNNARELVSRKHLFDN